MGALPVLRLSLWGREVIAKDKPLGVGLVDLASLPSDGKALVTWETLEPATGMDPDMACGRCVCLLLCCVRVRRSFVGCLLGVLGSGDVLCCVWV